MTGDAPNSERPDDHAGPPPSISIIGSFRRFYDLVRETAEFLAANDAEVRSPSMCRIVNPDDQYVRFECDPPDSSDHDIQDATLARLLASDAVYVIAPDGYIGLDTSMEIGQLRQARVPLYFSEPPRNVTIAVPADAVVTPDELLARLQAQAAEQALINPPTSRPRVDSKLTADLAIFTIMDDSFRILLVERGKEPEKGKLALPGGFVRPGEDLEMAAERELREETGLDPNDLHLEQIRTYSAPDRDPRGRVATTAFLAITPQPPALHAGSDARGAAWHPVTVDLPERLAFDHPQIFGDALERARQRLENTTIAAAFCPKGFTITELHRVYELVWGRPVDRGNFARKVLKTAGFVQDNGEIRKTAGRPAKEYRRGPATELYPAIRRGTVDQP